MSLCTQKNSMPLTSTDLIRWENERDIDKFIQILKYLDEDQYSSVRVRAVKAICRIRDIRGLHFVLKALADYNHEVAENAKKELIAWGTEDICTFCEFVENENGKDRDRFDALFIISNISSQRVIETYLSLLKKGLWVDTIQDFVREMNSFVPFISLLMDDDPETRFAVISGLGKIYKNPIIVNGYIDALADEDVQVRCKAAMLIIHEIRELKELENDLFDISLYKKAIEPLITDLSHGDFLVRAWAANVLGEIQDQKALDFLFSLLSDPYEKVRSCAVYTLAQIPNEIAFPQLASMYYKEQSIEVRKDIIFAMFRSLHPNAFDFLIRLGETEKVTELWGQALKAIAATKKDEATEFVLKMIDKGNIERLNLILEAIDVTPAPQYADAVLKILEEENDNIDLRRVFHILRQLKEKKVLVPLIRILGKTDHQDRSIIRTIKEILEPETIEQFLENIDPSNDKDFISGIKKIRSIIQT